MNKLLENRVLIVDGNHTLHRSMHVKELSTLCTPEGKSTGGVYGFLKSLRSAIEELNADSVVVVFDYGRSTRRMQIYPDYKKKSIKSPDDQFEHDNFLKLLIDNQYALIDLLEDLNIPVIRCHGREGDDTINVVSKLVQGKKFIVSDDWDLAQLVDKDIDIYRQMHNEVVSLDNFKAATGLLNYTQYALYKAILGDKDNLPATNGVGATTVKSVLNRNTDISIDNIDKLLLNECKSAREKKLCTTESLNRIKMNYQLSDITLEEFTEDEINNIKSILSSSYKVINDQVVVSKFLKYSFNLLSPIGWLEPFYKLKPIKLL